MEMPTLWEFFWIAYVAFVVLVGICGITGCLKQRRLMRALRRENRLLRDQVGKAATD